MSSDHSSERTGLDEAPVDKFLRLAGDSGSLLRGKRGQKAGAYVTLNVGGITPADRTESDEPDD
jgi:hypothetical protein